MDGSVLPGALARSQYSVTARLRYSARASPTNTVVTLHGKITQLASKGCTVCVQWVLAHVGVPGNQAAGSLAKATHSTATPATSAVTQIDESCYLITQDLVRQHPDARVAAHNVPARIPTKFGRQEAALLSRLRTGSATTNARLQLYRKRDSPACPHCGLFESTGHCLVACPAYHSERDRLRQACRRLGVPCSTKEDLLFPRGHRILLAETLQHLVAYLDETGLPARL
ncbi:hypothetical protein HPB48_012871 [Haemaphysalis longicornis]|uniref:RNase H type-1 domain-containing protein n=1 Tax=Haemaphysalis longicornis TaxID=44386 RepID=A0A9J6GB71_HAELO|nr:hypothetical protein HPB48_012871 [Haemaphysalis longicornis]